MVDCFITKPLGLVLILTAHMVFNGSSHATVIGIAGKNITLHFQFNVTVTKQSRLAVYTPIEVKIAEYPNFKDSFEIYPENSSVFYHITNLTKKNSKFYWVTLFLNNEPFEFSNTVELIVHEDNTSTTVPPNATSSSTTLADSGSSSFFSFDVVIMATSMMLLAAATLFLTCCLLKTKDQQEPQRNSNPTLQETIDTSIDAAGPSLIYSVLDFARRPATVVEINPSDTEYAAVSHVPEKRHASKTDLRKPANGTLYQ